MESCFICTEENVIDYVSLGFHTFHVTCLVEILKRNLIPKNPLTNQPFSSLEINLIEESAHKFQIPCPSNPDRTLILTLEKDLDNLQAMVHSETESKQWDYKFENIKREIQDIVNIVNSKEKFDMKENIDKEATLKKRFIEFEQDILNRLHHTRVSDFDFLRLMISILRPQEIIVVFAD